MRYFLQWAIAYAFALASAVMASLFGFMSAAGPYAYAKAAVLCLVAFAGCHGPAWMARLRHAYGIAAAFLGLLAAFACLIVTLWGGLGTMASGGEELRAERTKAATDVVLDREELARTIDQRRKLQPARPAAAVRPLISTAKDGSTYKAKLEAELATAEEGERLDQRASELNDRLRKAPPPLVADPEASAFSQLTGISVATSAAIKALLVSLALEAAAMVAMLVAWAERREPKKAAPAPSLAPVEAYEAPSPRISIYREPERLPVPRPVPPPKPRPQIDVPRVFGSIKKFVEQRIAKPKGERLEVRALFVEYRNWCKESSLPAADLDRFLDEIERLFQIEVKGGKVFAVNAALAG